MISEELRERVKDTAHSLLHGNLVVIEWLGSNKGYCYRDGVTLLQREELWNNPEESWLIRSGNNLFVRDEIQSEYIHRKRKDMYVFGKVYVDFFPVIYFEEKFLRKGDCYVLTFNAETPVFDLSFS